MVIFLSSGWKTKVAILVVTKHAKWNRKWILQSKSTWTRCVQIDVKLWGFNWDIAPFKWRKISHTYTIIFDEIVYYGKKMQLNSGRAHSIWLIVWCRLRRRNTVYALDAFAMTLGPATEQTVHDDVKISNQSHCPKWKLPTQMHICHYFDHLHVLCSTRRHWRR